MATTITPFNHFSLIIADGTLGDLDALTINVALVTSSYTWDATDTQWSEISTNEVATGDGYTTGGAAIASLAVSAVGSGVTKLDGNDVTWSSLTKTFRFGIAYADGSFGGLTDPVLFGILFDDTPADVAVSGIDFVIVWHSSGILTIGP